MWYFKRLPLTLTLLSWISVVCSQNCQLQVPANPFTAQGLATPYVLTGCNQLDFANQGAFVEAAILDPATGNIQIYSPLVINAGMMPVGSNTSSPNPGPNSSTSLSTGGTLTGATNSGVSPVVSSTVSSPMPTKAARQAASAGFYVPPIVPTIPNNAAVGVWFGSNAGALTLTGDTGTCVNGLGNSIFGQFAHCNGQAWFNAAKQAVSKGLIKLPPPGTASNGQMCPTTHDFRIVDQDQSDNVVTTYLLIGGNTLAQNSPENKKANPDAVELSNASDNALVTQFIDPALGCSPYQNPCPTCPTGQGPALATDELLANFFPPAGGPALVPLNDPMVLVNGQQSLQKVNLYRDGTGQPRADNNNASAVTYCQQISQAGIFINGNQQLFTNSPSPLPGQATNLFTFLAMRFSASFGPAPGLGCTGLLNVANPVGLTMDGNGAVTAANINTQELQQILSGTNGGNGPTSTGTSSTPAMTATSSMPRPSGVLLHLTSMSSSSSTPVSSGTLSPMTSTSSSIPLPSSLSSPSMPMPVSTGCLGPTCTVTITVTATVCPSQGPSIPLSSATSVAPPSPTASGGYWNDGWRQGEHHWKRSMPFKAQRRHRKSRIAPFV